MTKAICGEYTSQQCPVCKEWIYVDGGAFYDDGKPSAGARHVKEEHPEVCETKVLENETVITSFPYLKWNDEIVEALIPNERKK